MRDTPRSPRRSSCPADLRKRPSCRKPLQLFWLSPPVSGALKLPMALLRLHHVPTPPPDDTPPFPHPTLPSQWRERKAFCWATRGLNEKTKSLIVRKQDQLVERKDRLHKNCCEALVKIYVANFCKEAKSSNSVILLPEKQSLEPKFAQGSPLLGQQCPRSYHGNSHIRQQRADGKSITLQRTRLAQFALEVSWSVFFFFLSAFGRLSSFEFEQPGKNILSPVFHHPRLKTIFLENA